ncbi:hypothetical protein [Streptomyces sp. NPDC053079]|uniref:hypothetical protein n=1 Tax=Streptomyces sp. NPDC053079 TaxID=3365697 RepID=UPI0037D002FA
MGRPCLGGREDPARPDRPGSRGIDRVGLRARRADDPARPGRRRRPPPAQLRPGTSPLLGGPASWRAARKHPPKDIAAKIDAAVRARWQPQVRKRRRKQAATATGITVETRARFGYTAYAQRLFDAREAGVSDQEMRKIIAEGFKEVYFQDGGGRAMGLSDVAINDIDYLDLEY